VDVTESPKEKSKSEENVKPVMVDITFQAESSLRFSFEQVLNEKGEDMQEQFVKFMKEYVTK